MSSWDYVRKKYCCFDKMKMFYRFEVYARSVAGCAARDFAHYMGMRTILQVTQAGTSSQCGVIMLPPYFMGAPLSPSLKGPRPSAVPSHTRARYPSPRAIV